jgi:DNA polymerase-4
VQPNRESKSVGAEDTFPEDLTTREAMEAELDKIAPLVEARLKKHQLKGRTVTVKIKFHDFKIITRSRSFPAPVDDLHLITATAKSLLAEAQLTCLKVRLLGITVSNFGEKPRALNGDNQGQLQLFA